MLYQINGECLENITVDCLQKDRDIFGIISSSELESLSKKWGINSKFVREYQRNTASKYESFDGFDYFSLNIPNQTDQRLPPVRVCIYVSKSQLVFVCDMFPVIKEMTAELQSDAVKNLSLGRILHAFLDRLTIDDALMLENMEQEITDLEEKLMETSKSEISHQIITLRRRLMVLKRYYEQLLEIAEEIEQNENEYLDKKMLHYFRMITNRIDRLYHNVLNLRDYVTQVREAYQAQIDIDLNSIMKLFTVVTSIFLPLTLIVGWYGMNLNMPEYTWKYGYVLVIGICAAVVILTVVYLKKKKWF